LSIWGICLKKTASVCRHYPAWPGNP